MPKRKNVAEYYEALQKMPTDAWTIHIKCTAEAFVRVHANTLEEAKAKAVELGKDGYDEAGFEIEWEPTHENVTAEYP